MYLAFDEIDEMIKLLKARRRKGLDFVYIHEDSNPVREGILSFKDEESAGRFFHDEEMEFWGFYYMPILIKLLKDVKSERIHHSEFVTYRMLEQGRSKVAEINFRMLYDLLITAFYYNRKLKRTDLSGDIAELREGNKELKNCRYFWYLLAFSKNFPGGKEVIDRLLRRYLPEDIWPHTDRVITPSVQNIIKYEKELLRFYRTKKRRPPKVTDVKQKIAYRKQKLKPWL